MIHHSRRESVVNRQVEHPTPQVEPEPHKSASKSARFIAGMQLDVAKDSSDRRTMSTATLHEVTETGFTFWSRADINLGDVLFIREFDAAARGGWIQVSARQLTRGLQGILVRVEFDLEPVDGVQIAVEPTSQPSSVPAPPPMPMAGLRPPGPGQRHH